MTFPSRRKGLNFASEKQKGACSSPSVQFLVLHQSFCWDDYVLVDYCFTNKFKNQPLNEYRMN